jgi:eukaryotic-like serine/threonine-protein kinase
MSAAVELDAPLDSAPDHSESRVLSHAAGGAGASDTSWVGQVIEGRYQIVGVLGQATLGTLYLAHHVHTRKSLALKLLDPALAALGDAAPRFEREAVATARINHPNVVAASDYGRLPDGVLYLVLEHVKGPSLREALASGPFTIERALSITEQLLQGLAAAHALGVVHRGVKPENVRLIQRAGAELAKLQDFGLSILAVDDCHEDALTRLGTTPGTPEYMAPEQATGHWVDARSDLYAVGIVLYELIAGRVPFAAADAVRLLGMHLNDPVPPLPAQVPDSVALLVTDLLEKDPDRRIQSAAECLARIESLKSELTPPAPASAATQDPEPDLVVPVASSRGPIVLSIAALTVVTALVAALIGRFGSEPFAPLASSLHDVGARAKLVQLASARAADPDPEVAPDDAAPKATSAKARGKKAARPANKPARSASDARRRSAPSRKPAPARRTGPFGIYVPPPNQWF